MFFIGLLSIAALIASARIQVPLYPVPVTLQTALVLLLPCLIGTRFSLGVLSAYFAAGFAGLPVFAMAAGSVAGPAYFFGPTGGYLLGFVAATFFVGLCYEQKNLRSLPVIFLLMLAGHAIILLFGAIWLAYGLPSLGFQTAVLVGIVPFLLGSLLKSGLACLIAEACNKA